MEKWIVSGLLIVLFLLGVYAIVNGLYMFYHPDEFYNANAFGIFSDGYLTRLMQERGVNRVIVGCGLIGLSVVYAIGYYYGDAVIRLIVPKEVKNAT